MENTLLRWMNSIFSSKLVANVNTKEIHDPKAGRKACNMNRILPKNRMEVSRLKAHNLVTSGGYDYCNWCFRKI